MYNKIDEDITKRKEDQKQNINTILQNFEASKLKLSNTMDNLLKLRELIEDFTSNLDEISETLKTIDNMLRNMKHFFIISYYGRYTVIILEIIILIFI